MENTKPWQRSAKDIHIEKKRQAREECIKQVWTRHLTFGGALAF
jgi:hypothetical protein